MNERGVGAIARWTASEGGLSSSTLTAGGSDRFGRMLAHVISSLPHDPDAAWIVATTLGPVAADSAATPPTAGAVARSVAAAMRHRGEVDVVNAGALTVAMALVDLCARPRSMPVVVAFVDVATASYDGAAVALRVDVGAEGGVGIGRPIRRELDDTWSLDAGLAAHPLAPALVLADRLRARVSGWLALQAIAGADGRRWCVELTGAG